MNSVLFFGFWISTRLFLTFSVLESTSCVLFFDFWIPTWLFLTFSILESMSSALFFDFWIPTWLFLTFSVLESMSSVLFFDFWISTRLFLTFSVSESVSSALSKSPNENAGLAFRLCGLMPTGLVSLDFFFNLLGDFGLSCGFSSLTTWWCDDLNILSEETSFLIFLFLTEAFSFLLSTGMIWFFELVLVWIPILTLLSSFIFLICFSFCVLTTDFFAFLCSLYFSFRVLILLFLKLSETFVLSTLLLSLLLIDLFKFGKDICLLECWASFLSIIFLVLSSSFGFFWTTWVLSLKISLFLFVLFVFLLLTNLFVTFEPWFLLSECLAELEPQFLSRVDTMFCSPSEESLFVLPLDLSFWFSSLNR